MRQQSNHAAYTHTMRSLRLLLAIAIVLQFNACSLFRTEQKILKPTADSNEVVIPMSEDYVRSKPGDLLSFIPKGWSLVDAESKLSSDVVAVAVNPDYTLSLIIQSIRSNDIVRQSVNREGLIGLARAAFERRQRKTLNSVRLMGSIDKRDFEGRSFGYYEFTADSSDSTAIRSRSVVLVSSIDNYYEVSLVPTTVTTAKLPEEQEIKTYLKAIVKALQY